MLLCCVGKLFEVLCNTYLVTKKKKKKQLLRGIEGLLAHTAVAYSSLEIVVRF